MKTTSQYKQITIAIISYLFVFRFIYAAISKLLDNPNFSINKGQSLSLSPFAGSLATIIYLYIGGICDPKNSISIN